MAFLFDAVTLPEFRTNEALPVSNVQTRSHGKLPRTSLAASHLPHQSPFNAFPTAVICVLGLGGRRYIYRRA